MAQEIVETWEADETSQLETVIKEVLAAIERSQEQLFGIAEHTRREYEELAEEVARIREAVTIQIKEVDLLEAQDRQARLRLLEVSENIGRYDAREVRAAYEEAREARVRLQVAREREHLLREQRDSLERRLKRLRETLRKAEEFINNVSLAFNLVSGRLKDISAQVRDSRQRHQMVFSIIKAQEEERRRLARDIHDGPAQQLANVVFRIDVCQKLMQTNPARADDELNHVKDLLRQSLQDVRKIIFDLRPMALDDLGLVPALRGYLAGMSERVGLNATIKITGHEVRLPSSLEVAVFRLIQETLNNVWKHAGANRASVILDYAPVHLRVVVEDDGCGFDVGVALAAQGTEHFGLVGMRERVALLGGSFDIVSQPGQGTRVVFTIPMK